MNDALGYSETNAMTRRLDDEDFMSTKLTDMNMKSKYKLMHQIRGVANCDTLGGTKVAIHDGSQNRRKLKNLKGGKEMMNIKEVANRLGETDQFIRTGLQKGMFPFGTAEKVDGKFVYNIDEIAFNRFMSLIKTNVDGKTIAMTLNEVITAINIKNIKNMELLSNKKGEPIVVVMVDNDNNGDLQFYNFPAIKGYQIHTINEFLRSLNLDNKIEFQNFKQYRQLLTECMELLKQSRKPLHN